MKGVKVSPILVLEHELVSTYPFLSFQAVELSVRDGAQRLLEKAINTRPRNEANISACVARYLYVFDTYDVSLALPIPFHPDTLRILSEIEQSSKKILAFEDNINKLLSPVHPGSASMPKVCT